MRLFPVIVLVLASTVSTPAFSQAESKTYNTPAGVFIKEWDFGGGGFRSDTLVTPDGQRLQLFPVCRPDKTCVTDGMGGGRVMAAASMETMIAVDKTTYLVMDDSIWRWETRANVFVEVYHAGWNDGIRVQNVVIKINF